MKNRERCRERERLRNEYPGDLFNSSFYAPLTNTIVTGRGSSTPTFTRATTAWSFDNEGNLKTVPSGCVRMQGARLVRNLLSASEDLNSASWTKANLTVTSGQVDPDGGTNAWKVEAASSAPITFYQGAPAGTNAKTYTYSFYVKKGSGELDANKFYLYDTTATVNVLGVTINYDTGVVTYVVGSTGVTVTSAPNGFWRVEMRADAVTQGNPLRCYTFFTGAAETGGEFAYFYHPQLENVSGQADQTASEYISNGVLSAPWHGAGVDGCKWFPTNKNGSAISASTLEGYLSEPVRTNNCLWGRLLNTFGTEATKVWTSSTTTSLLTNGDFSTNDLTAWTNVSSGTGTASAATGAAVLVGSDSSNRGAIEQGIATVIGQQYLIKIDVTITSGTCGIGISTSPGSPTGTSLASTAGTNKLILFTATATTTYIKMWSGPSGGNITVDNVSASLAGIQVTTTTGLDNVANSASRLTAAANDATIMQLLTAATGTRTASAFIKRISGTGTISLTRNGGTNWTDITSSLVTGSWVLVKMTSDVGANPTVGIKMGTSGDVIDVDCVQDENGAWATSPILTTTTAVTRNADVLSYASAFDVAQGTALCSVKSAVPINSGQTTNFLRGDGASASLAYVTSSNSRTATASTDGTNIASVYGGDITTGIRKKLVRWGSDLRMSADGSLGSSVAFDGSMGTVGTLYIGCNQSSVDHLSGPIREVHIWPTPLTDAQMQQVTK